MEDLGTRIRQQGARCAEGLGSSGAHGPDPVGERPAGRSCRSPGYAEQVAWDLDAADIAPERLIVEVLESVAADARDDPR